MTRPAIFTQGDIAKLLKGAKAAGVAVSRVTIEPTGAIVAEFTKGGDNEPKPTNEWEARISAKREQAPKERH